MRPSCTTVSAPRGGTHRCTTEAQAERHSFADRGDRCRALRAGAVRVLLYRSPSPSEAAQGRLRRRRDFAAPCRCRDAVLAGDDAVRERGGRARARSIERKIDGALVAGPAGAKLIVVPAASNPGASALERRLYRRRGRAESEARDRSGPPVASGRRQRGGVVLRHDGTHRRRLPLVDARDGVRRSTSRRRRLGSLAIAAVIGALLTDTLAGPVLGAIPTSKFLVLWALFTLIMMAVAFATAALQTLLGAGGTLVVVIVFVIFGAPSSGGTRARVIPTHALADDRPLPAGRRRHDRRTEHHLLRRQPDRTRPWSSLPRTSSSERSPCSSYISRRASTAAPRQRRRPPRRRPLSHSGAELNRLLGRQGVLGRPGSRPAESSSVGDEVPGDGEQSTAAHRNRGEGDRDGTDHATHENDVVRRSASSASP